MFKTTIQAFWFLPITNPCDFGQEISNVPNVICTWGNFDPIETHYKVLASGKYNFLGCRIQVPLKKILTC